jgi:hypothetical protein
LNDMEVDRLRSAQLVRTKEAERFAASISRLRENRATFEHKNLRIARPTV